MITGKSSLIYDDWRPITRRKLKCSQYSQVCLHWVCYGICIFSFHTITYHTGSSHICWTSHASCFLLVVAVRVDIYLCLSEGRSSAILPFSSPLSWAHNLVILNSYDRSVYCIRIVVCLYVLLFPVAIDTDPVLCHLYCTFSIHRYMNEGLSMRLI